MAIHVPQSLIEELVRLGRTTREQAKKVADQAVADGKDVGAAFVDAKVVTDEELLEIKSALYKLPVFSLAEMEPDPAAFKEISEDVAGFYRIVPFGIGGGVLKVGIVNPEDIDALEALKFIAADKGLTLEKYVIGYEDFGKILKRFKSLTGEVGKALESIVSQAEAEAAKDTGKEKELKLEEITAESPVTKIVSSTVSHAIDMRTSDIHIEPFEDIVRIRYRIDGVLQNVLELPRNLHSAVVTRVKILTNLKIDETRLPQDGRFSIVHNNTKIDFRVSTFPTKNGEKIVMRILDPLASRVDLSGLGIDDHQLKLLQEAMAEPFGIILI
ncbi:MAG: ATPase, T2SS/T4P/T4SS family, partial [Rubricoccaceae bacterium]|nr:ATPase, T2SS/T4P/T4SS family [Rubricoccaceae bacterium]